MTLTPATRCGIEASARTFERRRKEVAEEIAELRKKLLCGALPDVVDRDRIEQWGKSSGKSEEFLFAIQGTKGPAELKENIRGLREVSRRLGDQERGYRRLLA